MEFVAGFARIRRGEAEFLRIRLQEPPLGTDPEGMRMEEINAHAQSFEWKPSWLLVLHTDGLRTHWQWSDFPGLERQPAQAIAAKLMRELNSGHDDGTVLAVRGESP